MVCACCGECAHFVHSAPSVAAPPVMVLCIVAGACLAGGLATYVLCNPCEKWQKMLKDKKKKENDKGGPKTMSEEDN